MRCLLVIGLLARAALADAPHGEYVLAVSDRPKLTIFVQHHQLSPCGERTAAVWSKLDRFAVRFRQARRPHTPDDVLVDNEPWSFTGYMSDGSAMAERTQKDSITAGLWFGRDSEDNAQGSINVVIWDAGKAICGDILALQGSYVWRP